MGHIDGCHQITQLKFCCKPYVYVHCVCVFRSFTTWSLPFPVSKPTGLGGHRFLESRRADCKNLNSNMQWKLKARFTVCNPQVIRSRSADSQVAHKCMIRHTLQWLVESMTEPYSPFLFLFSKMPRGFFCSASTHPHTLQIWAEVLQFLEPSL